MTCTNTVTMFDCHKLYILWQSHKILKKTQSKLTRDGLLSKVRVSWLDWTHPQILLSMGMGRNYGKAKLFKRLFGRNELICPLLAILDFPSQHLPSDSVNSEDWCLIYVGTDHSDFFLLLCCGLVMLSRRALLVCYRLFACLCMCSGSANITAFPVVYFRLWLKITALFYYFWKSCIIANHKVFEMIFALINELFAFRMGLGMSGIFVNVHHILFQAAFG